MVVGERRVVLGLAGRTPTVPEHSVEEPEERGDLRLRAEVPAKRDVVLEVVVRGDRVHQSLIEVVVRGLTWVPARDAVDQEIVLGGRGLDRPGVGNGPAYGTCFVDHLDVERALAVAPIEVIEAESEHAVGERPRCDLGILSIEPRTEVVEGLFAVEIARADGKAHRGETHGRARETLGPVDLGDPAPERERLTLSNRIDDQVVIDCVDRERAAGRLAVQGDDEGVDRGRREDELVVEPATGGALEWGPAAVPMDAVADDAAVLV